MPRGDLFQQKERRLFPKISSVCPDAGEAGNSKDDTVIKREGGQVEQLEILMFWQTCDIQKEAYRSASLE